MKKIFATLILFCVAHCTITLNAQSLSDRLKGKCGAELKSAINSCYRPKHIVSDYVGIGGAWEAFRNTDAINGCVVDRYSSQSRVFSSDGHSPSQEMTIDQIVNLAWWEDNNKYGDTLKFDLHHLIPCDQNVPSLKEDFPPGIVTNATYDNGVWKSGLGEISGYPTNIYEPADEYKGDFARAIMYIISIYPTNKWQGRGINFCQNNTYPAINNYAKQLLLNWHRNDPVSDFEEQRNNAITEIQGNSNPFIDFPQLAEHVWGTLAETPFDVNPVRVPLRSTYKLSDDFIDLYHPSIPQDVTWSINNSGITTNRVKPSDLGVGIHQLRFRNGSIKGKLMIKIIE